MINRDILESIENGCLTQGDIAYLLDRLRNLGTKTGIAVTPKVIIFLKSKTHLDHTGREEVAKYLYMSSRTLSRKLKKEHTGFYELLNEERKHRCLNYMRCNKTCGREITELLGLSDISQFYKYFKKWTGYSFSEAKAMLAENHLDIDTIFHRHESKTGR